MKVSDYIAKFLKEKGIKFVFELSGGMITHLLDSLNQNTDINIITMHHEQSAAFAADAYGRGTGLPGVALATSGPGATNLLTGIGNCYFDSVPAIFITGQVNRHEQKGNMPIRQLGFQETDIVSMAKPITKSSFLVNNPQEIPAIFENAFKIATEGRPGPVLIDIPMDVQRAQIDVLDINTSFLPENKGIDVELISNLINDIQKAARPLILVGRGVRSSFATEELLILATHLQIPIITTLLALDAINYNHPLRVGFIGSYGNRWANIAFGESDFLLVLGSRLDIRQTGANTIFFENGRKIYHVDCEIGDINNRIKGCIPIVADLQLFFKELLDALKGTTFLVKTEWINYLSGLKKKWSESN